jgi:phenylalanyl-tRNA synthetase beta chain
LKVPLSWLRSYIDVTLPPRELGHRLTMAGLETSGIEMIGKNWGNILVGHVVAVEQHPNADRLSLATVGLGTEEITVVCGAPNVAAGQRIAFAKIGARLTDPQTGKLETLKAAQIRGVISQGMVCSKRELSLGDDHTGILVLDENAPIGTPLADYMGDAVLDLEVTPNRPDWLSILGVAHEAAAISEGSVREPDISYPETGTPIEDHVTVVIDATDLCPRYTASLVNGIRVGPSPDWMQERLLKAGQRPINNIVDITNYVMLEYGQPLHAFDYHALGQKLVRIRRARKGEALVTLGGESHRLTEDMLVIADAEWAIALAGVMGGVNTEVTESTTSILLESANFSPGSIRRTSLALKMRSEASMRFERGVNPELASIGLRRATQLILELAGGQAAQRIIDVYPGRPERHSVALTLDRTEKVLGVRIPLKETERILTSLGFQHARKGRDTLEVEVPYWRSDIAIEEDLIEELARVRGYDSIPTTFLSGSIPLHQPQPDRELRERMKDLLVTTGLQEVITYPLAGSEGFGGAEAPNTLKVVNPMTPEHVYLRTSLRESILSTLGYNQRFGQSGVSIFEVGRGYLPRSDDLPEEREMAVGLVWGDRSPLSWTSGEEAADFYDAKGTVEAVLAGLGLVGDFNPGEDPLLLPGKTAWVTVGGQVVGVIGEVRPEVQERFEVSSGVVAMFELDLGEILPLLPERPQGFKPLAQFPGSHRDLALLVDASVSAAQLESIIRRNNLVRNVTVFDVYSGKGVARGKRSIGLRVHFQSSRQTLTSEAVNKAQERVLSDLERETGAQIRG